MSREEAPSDSELIALGRDPLDDPYLYDHDDLWTALERLGYERPNGIPTTTWDAVEWPCPRDDCPGRLALINTGVAGLPATTTALDASVDHDDPDLNHRLHEARSPTVPLVVCSECSSVFEATFRRLRDPDAERLPAPRIVETPGVLGGRPRIDGTRIGVNHVWPLYEQGQSAADIATDHYPPLSEAHVTTAIEWAQDHPDRMSALRHESQEHWRQYTLLQSVVDAAVEPIIDTVWDLLVAVRIRESGDELRPVASLLRTGFENATGLNIDIDPENQQVIIDVADEVIDSEGGSDRN